MKKIKEGNIERWYHEGDLRKEIDYYDDGQKGYEAYWLKGKRHREEGQPARINWHKNGQKGYEAYYLNGRKLTEKEITLLKRKRKLNKLIYEED